MLQFIRHLAQRYRSVIAAADQISTTQQNHEQRLYSLELAEAFLEKGKLIAENPDHPTQIAVIGPTQSGKSSLVNLILGQSLAEVSPLAGFTTYPQGFAVKVGELNWAADYFHGFERFVADSRPAERHDCFTLLETPESATGLTIPSIVWDTPDFDSIRCESYQSGLLRGIALADLVVLVVSKDKYADQTVWQMMELIEPLNQPTIICLNKIQTDNLPVISASLTEKWKQNRSDSMPVLISLPFCKGGLGGERYTADQSQTVSSITDAVKRIRRKHHPKNAHQLISRHWDDWTGPVRLEIRADGEWESIVADAVDDALQLYRQNYLDHPQHYETFQRALAELLTLLEIPGIAPVLMRTRQIITWPVRQLFRFGQSGEGSTEPQGVLQETLTLEQIFEHFIVRLSEAMVMRREEDAEQWQHWHRISGILKQLQPGLRENYHTAMRAYQADFQPEIEAAAGDLYKKLQSQPATLNSLRATRFTTDAAAVAVALKTGGIGVQDFLLTPAVLSLTSYLTESALGGYMNRVIADLKKKQFDTVNQKLFVKQLKQPVLERTSQIDLPDRFGIDSEELEKAESGLRGKRYGLRLF